MHVMPAQAGIQCLKSLDYEIHPCISYCGPAVVCSLKVMDSILNITLSVMARRANHRDVMSKSAPGRFSPAKNMPERRYLNEYINWVFTILSGLIR